MEEAKAKMRAQGLNKVSTPCTSYRSAPKSLPAGCTSIRNKIL